MKIDLKENDREIVFRQIGREPRGMVSVAARCVCSKPLVVVTAPRVPEPFPTLFYLTSPELAGAISTLEAGGFMKELQRLLEKENEEFNKEIAQKYAQAHATYIQKRDELANELGLEPLTSTHSDFSAGGMPNRVKCLHALVAHELATGENPIGRIALDELKRRKLWEKGKCICKK